MPGGTKEDASLHGESAFMRLLGMNFEELDSSRVVATFEVGPDHHQPWGLVHGGVHGGVRGRIQCCDRKCCHCRCPPCCQRPGATRGWSQ